MSWKLVGVRGGCVHDDGLVLLRMGLHFLVVFSIGLDIEEYLILRELSGPYINKQLVGILHALCPTYLRKLGYKR